MGRLPEPRLRVAIIGAGRMGRALERACGRAGIDVVGVLTRSDEPRTWFDGQAVDAVLLAVPDGALAQVVGALDGAAVVGDALVVVPSGAASIEQLASVGAGLRVVRIHPMQSVTSEAPDGVLDGVTAAVTARSADREDAHRLASLLGMEPFDLRDEDAATWHAAGVLAAGAVSTLLAASEELAVAAGLGLDRARATVTSLARTAVDAAASQGPARAMTGPVVRGDEATIAAHVDALRRVAPHAVDAYVALGELAAHVLREAATEEVTAWA